MDINLFHIKLLGFFFCFYLNTYFALANCILSGLLDRGFHAFLHIFELLIVFQNFTASILGSHQWAVIRVILVQN